MTYRVAPPDTPLTAGEFFNHSTAGPDPVQTWCEYCAFCKRRGGKPVSNAAEFEQAWQAQREKYAARRKRLGIVLPPKKARVQR